MLSLGQLCEIMPTLSLEKAGLYLPLLAEAMIEASIATPRRAAAFLAQLAHESRELRAWVEGASGAAYEGRRDLGNVFPGDGPKFKGRGPIQLTGRANYRAAGDALGVNLETQPELAAEREVGFRVAGWYWRTRGLNALADANDFDRITRRINGGLNGKAQRDAYYARALDVLHVPPLH
jgi:putative chitinase